MSLEKQIRKTEDVLEDFHMLPLEIKQLDNSNEILILENQLQILKTIQEIRYK